MSAVTTEVKRGPSVLEAMAERYGMMPAAFEATVRATVVPNNTTKEEFAAFLLVAKEYRLNPLTKEIYAFPKKGGGIVPIVSIDGWVSLVNSHDACDGFEFEFTHAENGDLISCICKMYRKDRGRPVTVEEFLSECIRPTDPWKMRHRMLRHKSMIQAARYAFGFSGVYDSDEGAEIAERGGEPRDITPTERPTPPKPPAPKKTAPKATDEPKETAQTIEHEEVEEQVREEHSQDQPQEGAESDEAFDRTQYFTDLEDALSVAMDDATAEEVFNEFDPLATFQDDEGDQGIAKAMKARALKRIRDAAK